MVLDGLGSFGVNVCCNDDGGDAVLVGEGIHFIDCDGFINRVALLREFGCEWVGSLGAEQYQGHPFKSLKVIGWPDAMKPSWSSFATYLKILSYISLPCSCVA